MEQQEKGNIWPLLFTIMGFILMLGFVYKTEVGDRPEMQDEIKKQNRLINEKSPYLLKHADNPIDWYPWGDEAFEKAVKEDKLVFLSIGYSSCHWCNVMEEESYSDDEVAKLMNASFVSIKVDREERPDLDNIYIAVCQILSGDGCGWPLNIIMTPNKEPFFATTYISKTGRFNRMGMMQLIPQVAAVWKDRREDLTRTSKRVAEFLKTGFNKTEGEKPTETITELAFDEFQKSFDSDDGGFGHAPKFPSPQNLLFLLNYSKNRGEKNALEMVEKTLTKMRLGGIYDHIGFGFHRYSTDEEWLVPHFEKMLYDQALLAIAYIETYQSTGKEFYKETAEELFDYLQSRMISPEGLFYSAEDADSEGEEGKFYIWTAKELQELLSADEQELFFPLYGIEPDGNFVEQLKGEKDGTNILHLSEELNEKQKVLIEVIRKKLFSAREKREHPFKDDKSLTDWNGMVIVALAKASTVFDKPEQMVAASKTADFILEKMRGEDGSLFHRHRQGSIGIEGMIDDYAYTIWGMIELYQATLELKYLEAAIELTEFTQREFWDEKDGGFFFTRKSAREKLAPWKDFSDGAIPSGNSIMMLNLLRISRMTANISLEEKADRIGRLLSNDMKRYPSGFGGALIGLMFGQGETIELVISGNKESADTASMIKAARESYRPNMVLLLRENDSSKMANIAPYTEGQTMIDGKATAYVCRNFNCNLPTNDIGKMLELLNE